MTQISQAIAKRLAFVKFLMRQAHSAAKLPLPMCISAVLSAHDAAELFLLLAFEHLNVTPPNKNKADFMEHFGPIDQAIAPIKLPLREGMKRLNNTRVAVKHHGVTVTKSDVSDLVSTAQRFIEEAAPSIFGQSLDSVSMLDFVVYEKVRDMLKEASARIEADDTSVALNFCAGAFDQLIFEYESNKKTAYGHSPFRFGSRRSFQKAFFMPALKKLDDRRLNEFVDHIAESVEDLQDSMRILALGIDLRRYSRFRLLTPTIRRDRNNNLSANPSLPNGVAKNRKEDLLFCLEFVMETALELQEFEFDFSHPPKWAPPSLDEQLRLIEAAKAKKLTKEAAEGSQPQVGDSKTEAEPE